MNGIPAGADKVNPSSLPVIESQPSQTLMQNTYVSIQQLGNMLGRLEDAIIGPRPLDDKEMEKPYEPCSINALALSTSKEIDALTSRLDMLIGTLCHS